MKKYNAKIIEEGIVMGPAFRLNYPIIDSVAEFQGVEKELELAEKSIKKTRFNLRNLHAALTKDLRQTEADIVHIHQLMLEDDTFTNSIRKNISEYRNSAHDAILKTKEEFVSIFQNMDDEYMAQRANDICEISSQVLNNLVSWNRTMPKKPSIFIVDELTCNDIITIDKNLVLGFVVSKGLELSHAAILARTSEIPTVFGIENIGHLVKNADTVIINKSEVIVDPDEATIQEFEIKCEQFRQEKLELEKFKGLKTQTTDGREIQVFANIFSADDLKGDIQDYVQGVGLFRSEFLFMERTEPPSEEEQYIEYKRVLEKLGSREVVIRTIDVGSDKPVSYIDYGEEKNPALGKRGIRVCLDNPDMFKTQLRALLRAACHGNLKIMYPMVTSAEEVKLIQKQIETAARELESEGQEYRIPPQGIMIETPAAALMSDELAGMVDFFSIGTNDLTQYTLACDRENTNLSGYFDFRHPALLKQIELCVKNAHENGIPCSICGEIANDEEMTETFLDMAVDTLSVSTNKILKIISTIRKI